MLLNHRYFPNDKPVLVLVHGLLSSLETFLPLKELLEPHFSLLMVDQRGHGQSPPSGDDYTAEAMAADLKRLLDHLQIKKIFLLGHSMGGRTALMFGKLYPDMILKLIIEDMGIHTRQIRTAERDQEKKLLAEKSYTPSLLFKNKEDIFALISPLYSYANDLMKTKVIERENGFELKFWPAVSVMYGYQGNFTDLTSTLTETQFPVLFMIADPEIGSAMTPTCIEHIKLHVPRAKLLEIKGSWHTMHKTHPKEFCQAVIDFCQQ